MGENKDNRWFYNCDEKFINEYKVKVKNHIKIITRLNPDFLQNKELFEKLFPNCKMAKRIRKNEDPENVKKYNWDLTPYDNTGYGDEYNFISFIITNDLNILEIIKEKFDNVFIRKNRKNTYTLKINCNIALRGIWKSEIVQPWSIYFPIAILSFGRYNDYGRTHKLLTKLKIKHNLFVEPFEYNFYKEWYDPDYCELIKAPEDFHLKNMGSTPMRNYILDYFINKKRVWLLDDNIKCYKRLYKGAKNIIEDKEIFLSIEHYINRYNNVGICSHNFNPFITEGGCRNIICKNSKCYSSMLIPTDNGIRFKHKHQEDNFISIDYVCKGYTNLCFNHILYDKFTSGLDKGGNTKHIYIEDENDIGRRERYDYSFETAKKLIEKGEIELKEDMELDNFVQHRPLNHEYWHCEFQYNMLENYDKNDISKNKNHVVMGYKSNLYLDDKSVIKDDKSVIKDDKIRINKLVQRIEIIENLLIRRDRAQDNIINEYKIVIPSYDRVNILKNKTLKMLENQGIDKKLIYIFVTNEEYEKYKNELPNYNIIIGKKGLLPQIEFIENYFKEGDYLVRIEDDIENIFKKIHSKKDYPSKITRKELSETEPIDLHNFIIEGFKLLKEHKLNLFGINKTQNAFMMGDSYSTDLRLIEGCFNGFINKRYKLVVCNNNNYCLEDLERTIIYYKNDGGVLRFNDIGYITTYNDKGGIKSNIKERDLKINENTKKINEVYSKYGSLKPNKRQNGEWFELKRKPKNI